MGRDFETHLRALTQPGSPWLIQKILMPTAINQPDATSPPSARMPLAHWHTQHGARFDEIDSWQVPVVYSTEDQEEEAARTNLALADVSFVAKVMLRGPGVSDLTKSLTGDSPATKPGGGSPLIADKSILACRLHEDQLLVLAGTSGPAKLERLLTTAGKGRTLLQSDATSTFAMFWLFGLHTDNALRRITHHDVAAMPSGSCAVTGLEGVPAILVRPPQPLVPSMRILIGWDVAEHVWEKTWQVGQAWGISPLGMDALDMLLNQRTATI